MKLYFTNSFMANGSLQLSSALATLQPQNIFLHNKKSVIIHRYRHQHML